jgi:hypothetical protein
LPAGYLNALENRLAETELALFQTLCEIYGAENQHLNVQPIPPPHLSKKELMEEWKRLPQRNEEESRVWWIEKGPILAYLWSKRNSKFVEEVGVPVADDATMNITSPYEHQESISGRSDPSLQGELRDQGQPAPDLQSYPRKDRPQIISSFLGFARGDQSLDVPQRSVQESTLALDSTMQPPAISRVASHGFDGMVLGRRMADAYAQSDSMTYF